MRARKLAEGLRGIDGLILDEGTPHTNMIFFDIAEDVPFDEQVLAEKLLTRGVRIDWAGSRRVRLVTHYWIDDPAVEKTISAFREVFRSVT
jgi:threonine aldolase